MNPALLIICFDRPDLAEATIEAAKTHTGPLLIFQDGGAPNGTPEKIKAIWERVETERRSTGFVTLLHQEEKNLGGRDGPWKAIQWAAQIAEAFIVLEEDIMPCPEMMAIYTKGLEAFQADRSVFALGAGPNKNPNQSGGPKAWTRSPLLLVWGWATWRDRLEQCKVPNAIYKERGASLLDQMETLLAKLYLGRELAKLVADPYYCWSYYLLAHALHNRMDILVPETKLTWNQGIGKNGRRTKTNPDSKWDPEKVKIMMGKPAEANAKTRPWQRAIEKIKFVGLLHELRNRLALRERLPILKK